MKKSKIAAMLLALLVSVCLWVYAVTVVNPDDTASISGIPVEFEGTADLERRGLMVTGGEDSTVGVKLKGSRSDLKELNNDTLLAVVNLSRITEVGEHSVSWSLEYLADVASGDISTESRSTNYITLTVSEIQEKNLPIELDYSVTTAENFWTEKAQASLSPQSVSIKGPAEEVSLVEKAMVRLNRTELDTRVEETLSVVLLDADGQELTLSKYCTVSAPAAELVLPVYHSKEVALEVELLAGGGVTAADMDCRISPARITVTGDAAALEAVPDSIAIMQVALADYVGESLPQVMMEEINAMLPNGVTNRSARTTVDVVLEFKDIIETREYTVPTAQIQRLDTLEELALAEGEVVITVRGRNVQLNTLDLSEIKVTVDLSRQYDRESGLATVTVELPDHPVLGVISGPYTVQVVPAAPTGEH